MKNFLETLGKLLALAGFLFTAFTYAWDQHVEREQARYSKAIEIVEGYRTRGIRDLEVELTTRLLYYVDGESDLNDSESYPDDLFKAAADETLFGFDGVQTAPESGIEPFLDELLKITDFYAEVHFCAEAGICNAEIARAYFCPRAGHFLTRNRRLMTYYGTYSGLEDWNRDLVAFVEDCS